MKKIFFVMAAVIAFAAVSCEKDNVDPNGDKKFIKELTVNVVNESSKVTVTEGAMAITFDWEDGDKVYVYDTASDAKDCIDTFVYDEESNVFKAQGTGLVQGTTYYAVSGSVNTEKTFNDYDECAYFDVELAHDITNLPMLSDQFVADADKTIADMHHLVSIVDIPVVGTGTINRPEFNAQKCAMSMRGTIRVYFNNDGTIGDISRRTSSKDYQYTYDKRYSSSGVNFVLSDTPQTLRFVIYPGEYTNLKMYGFKDDSTDNRKEGATLGDMTFERGVLYKKQTPVTLNF